MKEKRIFNLSKFTIFVNKVIITSELHSHRSTEPVLKSFFFFGVNGLINNQITECLMLFKVARAQRRFVLGKSCEGMFRSGYGFKLMVFLFAIPSPPSVPTIKFDESQLNQKNL